MGADGEMVKGAWSLPRKPRGAGRCAGTGLLRSGPVFFRKYHLDTEV